MFGNNTFGSNSYKAVAAATMTPWEVIDKLYQGAITFIDQGQTMKASRVVEEGLYGALEPNSPLTAGYVKVYKAIITALEVGNRVAAKNMLQTMHEAWKQIKPQ